MANDSVDRVLRAYSLPLILFSLGIFFQLFILPTSFPPSHYDVLGIKMHSSIEEVTEAYEKLLSKWNSGMEVPPTNDFIKVRYAFELLTNPLWKRDYDKFGIDEQLHIMEGAVAQYAGKGFSSVDLPLLNASSDIAVEASNVLTTEEFRYTLGSSEALLLQVYSSGSKKCANFFNNWKRIDSLLDGVGRTAMVELGDVQLAVYLAERNSIGKPFFRNGLPSVVALPSGCKSSDCLARYQGDLSVDAVTDWFATGILNLPRILYYSKESLDEEHLLIYISLCVMMYLGVYQQMPAVQPVTKPIANKNLVRGQNFISKSGHHKVKVICFSRTGERAAPFLRQAARDYWAYASFAFVLWREEDSSFWWNTFEVESAPAIVFMKTPGVKPTVVHGTFNSSTFTNIIEHNKQQDLPQLRSITSLDLGCDARGHSRAGKDTTTWYCVILAGRLSMELSRMRETMLRVQDVLSKGKESNTPDEGVIANPLPAALALEEKRLTFTWLDGEMQKQYCFFYVHSETSYETCGPRRDITDVPQLLIVRYKKNSTNDEKTVDKKAKTIWDQFQEVDENAASQLVARYNGSAEIEEIIQWISQIVKDGDSRDLPFFRTKTPELIPEDAEPIWSKGAQRVLSTGKGMRQRIQNIVTIMRDWLGDPRIGPMLLLGAALSFGSIWLHRSQSSKTNASSSTKENPKPNRRSRTRSTVDKDQPSSIADAEPKDAQQWSSSGSDSE